MKVVFDGPFPGTLKEVLRLQGLDCGRPRRPSAEVEFMGKRILRNVMAQIGVI
jgi:dihydrodipicolinate synthase/N-acetylneuraminate lyase